jgi:Trk-type K+ transport system membrane component
MGPCEDPTTWLDIISAIGGVVTSVFGLVLVHRTRRIEAAAILAAEAMDQANELALSKLGIDVAVLKKAARRRP